MIFLLCQMKEFSVPKVCQKTLIKEYYVHFFKKVDDLSHARQQFKGLFILTFELRSLSPSRPPCRKTMPQQPTSVAEVDVPTTYFYSKEEGRLVSPLIKSR